MVLKQSTGNYMKLCFCLSYTASHTRNLRPSVASVVVLKFKSRGFNGKRTEHQMREVFT